MSWHLLRKELRQLLRRGSFQLAAGTLLLLLLASVAVSSRYQAVRAAQIETAQAADRERWENQGSKNQHAAAHFGMYLYKPQSVLAGWDSGVEKYTGATVYVEAHKRNGAFLKAVQDSPALATWGELSPAFVLLVLLPLLLIWLGHDQVVGEKVAGTYRLFLAQGGSPKQWFWTKALSLWLVALALVVPAFGLAGWLLARHAGEAFWQGRSLALLGVYLAYLGVFIHLTLAFSARAGHSTTVLAGMLACWVLAIWLVPKAGTQWTRQAVPVPSEKAFQEAVLADIKVAGIPSHAPPNEKKQAALQAVLAEYEVESPEALPINLNGLMLQASEEANDPVFDQHYAALYARYQQQETGHALSGLLSPFLLARELSMGLCRTGTWAHIDFTEQAEQHRRLFVKTLNLHMAENGAAGTAWDAEADNALWQAVPRFAYQPPGWSSFFSRHGLALALLLGWLAFATALALLATRQLARS